MSMHSSGPQGHDRSIPAHPRAGHSGFGMVQVMLILMFLGGALAAGALLLQSKRPVQQALGQEETIRWADEAVAAFAASNARLPCPAPTVHGEEDCSGASAQGWLPMRTLLGASGTAPQVGPVAYMVYRGGETTHLDLTRPGNAWQPTLVDGSIREIVKKDEDGEETSRRPFSSINGLDLCRSLELAEAAGFDAVLARITAQGGMPRNVAYGIAAAGPQAAQSTRLDAANAGSAQTMEAPWRQWDSGYDDRVRVRTFDGLGQTLGCRLLAGGDAAAPYNASLAAMDTLAAAVTLHDALTALQDNNIDATEAALQGAIKAQVSLVFKLVTTAASLSDQITTLVTSAVNLTRAVATCIASLGATCWEVPLKAAAVGTSIAGLGTKGVTLAAKAASLPFVALALEASVKARDLAKRNGPKAPPQNLEEARQELECTLWARNCTEPNEIQVIYKTDGDGNPIQATDARGEPLFDDSGNPVFVVESEIEVPRTGLEEQTENARREWQTLQKQVDLLQDWRLAPWGRGVANDGTLTELTRAGADGQARSSIAERIDPGKTCGTTTSNWARCPPRYRKTIEEIECRLVDENEGQYKQEGGVCTYVGNETVFIRDEDDETDEGEWVTRPAGDRDRIVRIRYEFHWDNAVQDAIARRVKAEEWSDLNLREGELKKELEQFNNNIRTWFQGSDSILARMKRQRDDAQHCLGMAEPALPPDPMWRQQCINARNAVRYIETCEKPAIVTECKYIGGGNGRYVDAQCTSRNGNDADGSPLPKDYGLQETSGDVYERDPNPEAICKPNMEARRDLLDNELRGLSASRGAAATAYRNMTSPWVAYPTAERDRTYHRDSNYNWFEWAIEVVEDEHGKPTAYNWVRSSFQDRYTATRTVKVKDGDPNADPPTQDEYEVQEYTAVRSLPWYAREPWDNNSGPNDISGSSPLLVTGNLQLVNKDLCRYFYGRQWSGSSWTWPFRNQIGWWGDTHRRGLYCQRYPYSRAFEDWRRAKVGADHARKNYEDTRAQYEKLKQEYEDMDAGGAPGDGPTAGMSFGAEASLEHADSRGSSGPQALQ